MGKKERSNSTTLETINSGESVNTTSGKRPLQNEIPDGERHDEGSSMLQLAMKESREAVSSYTETVPWVNSRPSERPGNVGPAKRLLTRRERFNYGREFGKDSTTENNKVLPIRRLNSENGTSSGTRHETEHPLRNGDDERQLRRHSDTATSNNNTQLSRFSHSLMALKRRQTPSSRLKTSVQVHPNPPKSRVAISPHTRIVTYHSNDVVNSGFSEPRGPDKVTIQDQGTVNGLTSGDGRNNFLQSKTATKPKHVNLQTPKSHELPSTRDRTDNLKNAPGVINSTGRRAIPTTASRQAAEVSGKSSGFAAKLDVNLPSRDLSTSPGRSNHAEAEPSDDKYEAVIDVPTLDSEDHISDCSRSLTPAKFRKSASGLSPLPWKCLLDVSRSFLKLRKYDLKDFKQRRFSSPDLEITDVSTSDGNSTNGKTSTTSGSTTSSPDSLDFPPHKRSKSVSYNADDANTIYLNLIRRKKTKSVSPRPKERTTKGEDEGQVKKEEKEKSSNSVSNTTKPVKPSPASTRKARKDNNVPRYMQETESWKIRQGRAYEVGQVSDVDERAPSPLEIRLYGPPKLLPPIHTQVTFQPMKRDFNQVNVVQNYQDDESLVEEFERLKTTRYLRGNDFYDMPDDYLRNIFDKDDA